MEGCTYKKDSNEPCEDCPQVMSALYRCSLLQKIAKEVQEDSEEPVKENKDES